LYTQLNPRGTLPFLLPGRAKEKEFGTQTGAMLSKFDDMMFQCIKLYQ
jgi:hypothetical protein